MATSIYPTFTVDGLDEIFAEFKKPSPIVQVGVAAVGPAAAYAEVWEWGNARQTKQGPRTVLGTNPDGESVWLSSQAPMGYIRVNEDHYLELVKIELAKVKFSGPGTLRERLQKAGVRMAKGCAEIIKFFAPVDSGQLSNSFEVVRDGDPLLDTEDHGGSMESRFKRVLNLRGV